MLSKVKDFINAELLKAIYHPVFEIYIHSACIAWVQIVSTINRVFILQKKTLRLIHFKVCNSILLLSFSNQKWQNFLIKITLEIVFLLAIYGKGAFISIVKTI